MTDKAIDLDDLLGPDPQDWTNADEFNDDGPGDGLVPDDSAGTVEEEWVGDDLILSWRLRGEHQATQMLRYDSAADLIRIFPRVRRNAAWDNPFSHLDEVQIQGLPWDPHDHSVEGELDGLLHVVGLPRGFSAVYEYGLGVARPYRGFLTEIERRTGCTAVRFTAAGDEGLHGSIFHVELERFEDYRSVVERNRGRAAIALTRVIEAECHNALADLFELELVAPKYGRHPVIQALSEEVATGYVLSDEDRKALLDQVSTEASRVAHESPSRFDRLREDIELVSLEVLIAQFEQAMSRRTSEATWQGFFSRNPFALQQLFSAPILLLHGQVHVRGADALGQGSRIADFLCMNTVTHSAVVVEIKTPRSPLMASTLYRGSGTAETYPAHRELSGAIGQVQAQMESVSRDMKNTPALGDIDHWHVRGAVISGTVSTLSAEQRDSFLRYREGLTGLTVLGYDEVGERLKSLRDMLATPPVGPGPVNSTAASSP